MFDYLDSAVRELNEMSLVVVDLGTVMQQMEELKVAVCVCVCMVLACISMYSCLHGIAVYFHLFVFAWYYCVVARVCMYLCLHGIAVYLYLHVFVFAWYC